MAHYTKMYMIRMTHEQWDKLTRLSDDTGLDPVEIIRQLIDAAQTRTVTVQKKVLAPPPELEPVL